MSQINICMINWKLTRRKYISSVWCFTFFFYQLRYVVSPDVFVSIFIRILLIKYLNLVTASESFVGFLSIGSGRCPSDFFHYRELDVCLQFGPKIDASQRKNVLFCPGNELIRIDSQEKKKYIQEITGIVAFCTKSL